MQGEVKRGNPERVEGKETLVLAEGQLILAGFLLKFRYLLIESKLDVKEGWSIHVKKN
jgi:hypothetical protein